MLNKVRPVIGGGAGGLETPEIFRRINLSYKSGILLLK